MAVMAQKQQEANDTRQLIEAEGEMRRHAMEFQTFQQQTPDQEQWLPAWQQRQQEMQKHIDGLKLTDGARLRLSSSFGRWGDGQAISIQGEAFKQSVGRAKLAVVNRANEAADAGDFNGVESALNLLPVDYTTPEERDAMRLDLHGKAKGAALNQLEKQVGTALDMRDVSGAKAMVSESPHLNDIDRSAQLARIDSTHAVNQQKDTFQALTLTDPQKALAELDDPAKFHLVSPGDREVMRVQAKNVLAGQSSDAWHDIKTRIDLGQVKKGETFDAIKELDPLTRQMARAYNANYQDKASMNTTAEYEAAINAIHQVQDDGSGLPRAQLEAGLEARFNGPHLAELKKRLDAKLADPSKSEVLKEPLAQLNRWAFDEKRMGEYQQPQLGPDGKPVVTEKAIKTLETGTDSGFLWWRRLPWMGGPVETKIVTELPEKQINRVMVDDPVKRDKVAAQIGSIRTTLEKEAATGNFNLGGKLAPVTPENAMKRMAELAKVPLSVTAASEAGGAPNPLLPPANTNKLDLNAILKRYAPNPGK